MNHSQPVGQKKVSRSWPIPRLVDDAIRRDPSLQHLVEVSSHLTPNLSGQIHRIFAYKNFVRHYQKGKPRISENGYRNLRLSLRLATHLIEAENLLDWWVHAAFGKPTKFTHENPLADKRDLLKKTGEYTDEQRQQTREALDNLSSFVVWTFDTWDQGGFSYARTSERTRNHIGYVHPLFAKTKYDRPALACKVEIHEGFREFAENGYEKASLEDQLRFSFMFAASIVHELTHCFGLMRRGSLCEEYHDENDPGHEHGWSWEQWVFGGLIMMSNGKLDPPGPLVWNTWADQENKETGGGCERLLVPMDWLAGWFRTEFWNGEDADRKIRGTLHFWEKSVKRVTLLKTPSVGRAKRPFAVFEDFEKKEEAKEPSTIHRRKRCCRGWP